MSVAKKRPAMVVAALTGDDILLCQITSKTIGDSYAIPLQEIDFTDGQLNKPSNIRPNRLFTADGNIVLYRAGKLKTKKVHEVVEKIIQIIKA